MGQDSTFARKFDRLFRVRLDRLNRLIRDGKTVDGAWEITPRHRIRYRRRGLEEEIILSGELVSVDANALAFRLDQRSLDGDTQTRQLALSGRWQTDERNRLSFEVERAQGPRERLTLQGAWQLGPKNEILYRLERSGSKARSVQFLRFGGYWDLGKERQIAYVLDADTDSSFRFRGAFQTASILQKKGELRYQLGAEAQGRRGRLQTITLLGKWKLSRDLSLEFEVPYSGGFRRAISFGATYAWDSRTSLSARLTTAGGDPLGFEATLHRDFLKGQGEAFVRLRRSLEESAVEGGLRLRW